MITKDAIIEAYLFLRKSNHSIPDEVLDFIKDTSLYKLKEIERYSCVGCKYHNTLNDKLCGTCGEEYSNKTE